MWGTAAHLMDWITFYQGKERLHEEGSPSLFDAQTTESDTALQKSVVETRESLLTLQKLLDEEIQRMVQSMTAATDSAPASPLADLVGRTKKYVFLMGQSFGKQIEKLEMNLTLEMTKLGKNLSRHPSHDRWEDWELSNQVQQHLTNQ